MTTLKIKAQNIAEVAKLLKTEKVWHMPFRYNQGHYEITLKADSPMGSLLELKYNNLA